jgi:transcription initiation factor TFIIH subunit 2
LVPSHVSREVLLITGSLSFVDPSSIFQTIDSLVKERIRVSIIGLSAAVNICQVVCQKTKGF